MYLYDNSTQNSLTLINYGYRKNIRVAYFILHHVWTEGHHLVLSGSVFNYKSPGFWKCSIEANRLEVKKYLVWVYIWQIRIE